MTGVASFSCSPRICMGVGDQNPGVDIIAHGKPVPAVSFHIDIQEYKYVERTDIQIGSLFWKQTWETLRRRIRSLMAYVAVVNYLTLIAWGVTLWKTFFFWRIICYFFPYDKLVCLLMAIIITAGEWWCLIPTELAGARLLILHCETKLVPSSQYLSNNDTVATFNARWNTRCRSLKTNIRRHRRAAHGIGLIIAFLAQIPYSDLKAYLPLLHAIRILLLTFIQYYLGRYCEALCRVMLVKNRHHSVQIEPTEHPESESQPLSKADDHGHDMLRFYYRPLQCTKVNYESSVIAGTPEELLEFIFATRLDELYFDPSDYILEDYLLTFMLFVEPKTLCNQLLFVYNGGKSDQDFIVQYNLNQEELAADRKRVVRFVYAWYLVEGPRMIHKPDVKEFAKTFCEMAHNDGLTHLQGGRLVNLGELASALYLDQTHKNSASSKESAIFPVFPLDTYTVNISEKKTSSEEKEKPSACLQITPTTTASAVVKMAAESLHLEGELILLEMKSDGAYSVYDDNEMSIDVKTANGRLFCARRDDLPTMHPLSAQLNPIDADAAHTLDHLDPRLLAYHCTCIDWQLFNNVHENEYLHLVANRASGITSNLDRLLLRGSEIQHWVTTEILLQKQVNQRVNLMKMFIQMAEHCREYNNMFAFSAIVLGLLHSAVSRLRHTWKKLPQQPRKHLEGLADLVNLSGKHRDSVHELHAPFIPFVPVIIRGLRDAYAKTRRNTKDNINLELLHAIADNLRLIRYAKSLELTISSPAVKESPTFDVRKRLKHLKVIDDQRLLMKYSFEREKKKY